MATERFRSEREVESRFIRRLLIELGWSEDEIHEDVPIEFRVGRQAATGRKPEADIVLAPPTPVPPTNAWVVIEAKKPTESLDDAADQAWSYAYGLKAYLFVTTNGDRLQIWQPSYYASEHVMVLDVRVTDLAKARIELTELLSRKYVLDRIHRILPEPIQIRKLDLSLYFRSLLARIASGALERRQLRGGPPSSDNNDVVEWPQDVNPGSRIQLTGLAGRGKTTCLALAMRHLARPPQICPIFLSLEFARPSSLSELIFEEVAPYLRATAATAQDIQDWFSSSTILLCLDDWDRAHPATRSRARAEFAAPYLHNTSIIIAGRTLDTPIPGFDQLTIGPYTDRERDNLVEHRLHELEAKFVSAERFWKLVPSHLRTLLNEPIILAKALEYVQIRHDRIAAFPMSLTQLLDQLFIVAVSGQDTSDKFADTVMRACELMLMCSYPTRLEELADVLKNLGSGFEPAEVAQRLVQAGILSKRRAGEYEYAHSIWRTHFRVRRDVRKLLAGSDAGAWVKEVAPEDRHLTTLLMASAIDKPDIQSTFLRALLGTDVGTYFNALRGRASIHSAASEKDHQRYCLEQVLFGRTELVSQCFPSLKRSLVPWNGTGSEQQLDGAGIVGFVSDGLIDYTLGLLPGNDRVCSSLDELYAGSNYTQHRGCRPDSGRLVSARSVLNEVKKLVDRRKLPGISWVGRERVRTLAFELYTHGVWTSDWNTITGAELKEWVQKGLAEVQKWKPTASAASLIFPSEFGKFWFASEILAVVEDLQQSGDADIPMDQLGLPGPDLPVDRSALFWEFYSPAQRIARVTALYSAVAETYRKICEIAFPGVSDEFLCGQGPLRAVVYVSQTDPGWSVWWEPVPLWGEPPVVHDECSPESLLLCQSINQTYAIHGRDNSWAFVEDRRGAWAPVHPEVTEIVSALLQEDLERLGRILEGAT
jgi:hypothetical protein